MPDKFFPLSFFFPHKDGRFLSREAILVAILKDSSDRLN